MRIILISLIMSILMSIPIYATISGLRIDNILDYNFTREHELKMMNHEFMIDNIKIKPFISVLNKETDLSRIDYSTIIKDNKYNYEFGFKLNNIALANINYIGFDMGNMKQLDSISFTDGKIRIIFDDLIDKGTLIFSDNRVILYNPTSLTIDPTIELLSNSTNKAYRGSLESTNNVDSNFKFSIIELATANYGQINTSNNVYYPFAISSTSTTTYYSAVRFTFNISNYTSYTINSIRYCYEGYYTCSQEIGINCDDKLYWHNMTSTNWTLDSTVGWDVESTICKTFSGSSITDIINATSKNVEFGIRLTAKKTPTSTTTTYTDFVNLTIDYSEITPPPTTNITNCNYICSPQIKSEKNPKLEYYARSSLALMNSENTLLFYNIGNDNLNNDCLIQWHDYKNKNNNLCINLNSGKAIYIKDFNEENMGFDSYWSVFHAFLKSIFG